MIKDYLKIFTKDDLSIFTEKRNFIFHTYTNKLGETTAYFNNIYGEVFLENGESFQKVVEIPTNIEEISKELLKLGALSENIRISHNDEDGLLVLDNINFNKIELLKKILYNQKNRKNSLELDKLTNNLVNENIRPQTLINILDLDDKEIFFNDIEITLHAINVKYPEKIKEVSKNLNKENYKKEIEKNISGVIVKKNGVFDKYNNIIFTFTDIEGIIINEIKSIGVNSENLKKLTKQPTKNAVSSSIKSIQKKIKKYNLESFLSLKYNRKEKVYNFRIL